MSNASVVGFAKWLGVKTCGGMAQAVGLKWPPPPAISLRNVLDRARVPLTPVDLQLRTVDGSWAVVDPNNAPVEVELNWTDPGAGTPKQAQWFELALTKRDTGEIWGGRSFSGNPGVIVGMYPMLLDLYTHYVWTIVAHNEWGVSPAATMNINTNKPAPPQSSSSQGSKPSPVPVTATGTLTLTLDTNNPLFQVMGVAWTVWHQTATGYGVPMNAYGIPGKMTLKGTGQYLISALVTVLGEASGNTAEFSGDATAPGGIPAIVWVWNGGNVTKSFKVTSTTDGYGRPEALIVLTS